ncbi:pyrroline-5-carboxylate reductase [Neolewinella lacunae]|uniref:Pyrroline-5-carboxylate reductase n=1 Tax=Neolewinella lacunae TaxID=1517758 RepID=A0A923PPB7_9BACT|nr:pyrroline-5-carboxylate reductase [Neolewinella lacunae]MBC6995326.1 pyrroline-5-carboxylate reductase [Neolewinella lacunae]MDN3633038.1 pyrroline-5-carboxylate reductase [Neolewinella lacunae]
MKILVIGGGNMGKTYARSLLRAHLVQPEDLMILERSPEQAEVLRAENMGVVHTNPGECLSVADLIILAVKPQDSAQLFETLRPSTDPQQVYLSIMAGVTIASIQRGLGVEKVIRAMPNLPAQIGLGMTSYTASEAVTRIELVLVQNLLNTTGKAIYVDNEYAIDATTAISGSGPAYVLYFMEAMIEAAQEMGFNASQAELLVAQTFRGAVELQMKNDLSCAEWIRRVSSKGGTTEAAMQTFRATSVFEDIKNGARAALDRAIELGKVD